jgi:hypothetical protein
MAWGKVDDNLAFHPKVAMAGNEAMGLWVRCMSYSCQQLTDGFIPDVIVESMLGQDAAQKLVEVGLWIRTDDGYQFKDWNEYQPSATAQKERRAELSAKRSENGKKGANKRWESQTDSNSDGKTMAKGMANEWQNDSPEPEPEPIKTLTSETEVPDDDDYSDDVKELCDYLANKVKENRYRVGVVGVTWFRAADRLLRVDKVTVDEAKQVIDWCQQNEFWQGNIKSMSKFREKYDTLTSQMRRDRKLVDKSKRDPNVIDFHDKPGWGFRNYEGEQ